MQITAPLDVIKPGQEQTISVEGMSIRKDGSVKKKGDMNVKWEAVGSGISCLTNFYSRLVYS